MATFKVIIIGLLGWLRIANAALPAYIHACSKSAADFEACCIKSGNEALPSLLKGDKQFQIPNLLPLTFEKLDLNAGPNLKIALSDVELFGLDTVTLKDMKVDFEKHTAYLDLFAKFVSVIGTYQVDGKILILPIQGSGPINITIENSVFKYSLSFELVEKDGVEYAIIQDNDSLDYKIGKAYFKLENLFNGNQQMGDNVNNFLNENEQDIIKELGGAIEAAITSVAKRVGGGILANIPYEELFLA